MTSGESRASRPMPTPRYFNIQKAPQLTEKWIGIETDSIQGGEKIFLYWKTLRGDLNTVNGRAVVADIVTEFVLRAEKDIAVGPAILLSECNPVTEQIVIDSDSVVGLYIEAGRRFNAEVVEEERFKRQLDPSEIRDTRAKVLNSLPTSQSQI